MDKGLGIMVSKEVLWKGSKKERLRLVDPSVPEKRRSWVGHHSIS
jgi:hypothetical protein